MIKINKYILKKNNLFFKDNNIFVDDCKKISLNFINHILYYEPVNNYCGYIVIIYNNLKNADVVFFHKDYKNYFFNYHNSIKTKLKEKA